MFKDLANSARPFTFPVRRLPRGNECSEVKNATLDASVSTDLRRFALV